MNSTISTLMFKKNIISLLTIAGLGAIWLLALKTKNATHSQIPVIANQTPVSDPITKKSISRPFSAATKNMDGVNSPQDNKAPKRSASLMAKSDSDNDANDYATLKNRLLKKGIYFGTYLNNDDVLQAPPRSPNYLNTISKYFNLYSIPAWFHHTEYSGRGIFNFSGPDEVANYAVKQGAKIHAHNLVWNTMLPPWLAKGTFTPDELSDIMKTHIQTVVRHYRDKYPGAILAWDVVNEPIADPYTPAENVGPTGLRKTVWSSIHLPGSTDPSDYIKLAFQWAHEADPNVKLYLNEGGIEYNSHKWQVLYTLVKKLKATGTPIDGIGFQCHFDTHYDHPFSELLSNMNSLNALGLKAQVTELDCVISTSTVLPWTASAVASPGISDFDKQAQIFKGTLRACILAKNCNAVIVFGAFDPTTSANRSWKGKNGKYVGPFYPNILDDNMKPKKAFKSMMSEASTLIAH